MESKDLKKYPYGFPKLERIDVLQTAQRSSSESLRVSYRGESILLPVVTVRIQCPIYRLSNVRTRTLQHEFLRIHSELPSDLFTSDVDSIEAQTAQNEILEKLVNEEDLLKQFEKEKTQQAEAIICDADGVIVNGNRRMCAWRKLYYGNEREYSYFETVRVAVLPDNDASAIEDMEFELQIKPEMKADYRWHAIAEIIQEKLEQGLTPTKVGQKFGKTAQQVNWLDQAYNYAKEYLNESGHPDEWSRVDKDEYAFTEAAKARTKLGTQGDKDLYDSLFKVVMSSPGVEGRLYEVVKDIATNIKPIAQEINDQLGSESLQEDPSEEGNASFEDSDKKEASDKGVAPVSVGPATPSILLGGGEIPKDDSSEAAAKIRNKNDNSKGGLVSLVQSVIQAEQEKEKESQNSNYVKKQVQKARTAIEEAAENIGPERDRAGIRGNLEKINDDMAIITKWLDS